jgi:phosphomannomutase
VDDKIFLFDIDGTLTRAREKIDVNFQDFFWEWAVENRVVFVTGSDSRKTIEQIGLEMWSQFPAYQCAGNQLWMHRMLLYENHWEVPPRLLSQLEAFLEVSDYDVRCGRHIEIRPGMINFSVIGRACSMKQRKVYYEWDVLTGERQRLVADINKEWPELEASAGGQISIDIYPKGMGKGQIIPTLKQNGEVIFFGDRTEPGGNDYVIARQLLSSRVHQVNGPEDTRRILLNKYGY